MFYMLLLMFRVLFLGRLEFIARDATNKKQYHPAVNFINLFDCCSLISGNKTNTPNCYATESHTSNGNGPSPLIPLPRYFLHGAMIRNDPKKSARTGTTIFTPRPERKTFYLQRYIIRKSHIRSGAKGLRLTSGG